jgi:putative heme-binding domain-containing protein
MKTPLALAAVFLGASVSRLVAAGLGEPVLRPFALMGNPPPVQMIVPGFVVRELPVQLTNVNNLAYGPDGKLYAYAYDGNVYRLEDTDGDGLEDKAVPFFKNENEEIVGSVGMAWGPDKNLYLASRQRVVRLRDKGNGSAALETFASGWEAPDNPGTRYLDVYGVAFDRAGNFYFGLGISDIRNAYRIDPATNRSKYTRTWDRGTIQKISPDGRREIFATGVRYTVSIGFNAADDLFATDQEGATWLFNGNPFDELLHIEPTRHYGFPPRHPQHLPGVIDEPSVFDYGPQHQAICGVHFNEPSGGGDAVFGPAWWRGDAIVAGSARGRIYRTKLYKSAAGYVARNETIAHLGMLTIDAVPTPQGDLVVTCHSGRPDWGTGPTGSGKLYKISYRDKSAPQPVFAYAASPTELRVVFDRPLDPARSRNLTDHAMIAMGEYVSGGDRFESFRPGYQAVKDQQKVPRYQLPVLSAHIDADQRALVLRTVPRTAALKYSISWRDGRETERPHDPQQHELRQLAAVDLQADLGGVQARWLDATGAERWSGWLPHPDLGVARALTEPSAQHGRLFGLLAQPGTLELKTQLDLFSMLHPAIQPGAKLDFAYPPEHVRVHFKSAGRLELKAGSAATLHRLGENEWELMVAAPTTQWLPVEITLQTGATEPRLDVSWSTDEDSRSRAFALSRILLPWATRQEPDALVGGKRDIPEIAGGDWERGRQLFEGAVLCSTCHQVDGKGGTFGPDLSNLIHRDYASVIVDINEPSAALNPDYLAVTIQLKNGQVVSGITTQNTPEHFVLAQPNGETLKIPRTEAVPGSTKPLGMSMMPPGLLNALNEQQRKDLLTYLLTRPETHDASTGTGR